MTPQPTSISPSLNAISRGSVALIQVLNAFPYEQALGNGGEEELPFNRKLSPAQPNSAVVIMCSKEWIKNQQVLSFSSKSKKMN